MADDKKPKPKEEPKQKKWYGNLTLGGVVDQNATPAEEEDKLASKESSGDITPDEKMRLDKIREEKKKQKEEGAATKELKK